MTATFFFSLDTSRKLVREPSTRLERELLLLVWLQQYTRIQWQGSGRLKEGHLYLRTEESVLSMSLTKWMTRTGDKNATSDNSSFLRKWRWYVFLLPGWVSMKPWNSRVLVYQRQELLLLFKLVALLLPQLIQLVEGTEIANWATICSLDLGNKFVALQLQVRFIQIICTKCRVDRSDPFSFWYPLCCQGTFF